MTGSRTQGWLRFPGLTHPQPPTCVRPAVFILGQAATQQSGSSTAEHIWVLGHGRLLTPRSSHECNFFCLFVVASNGFPRVFGIIGICAFHGSSEGIQCMESMGSMDSLYFMESMDSTVPTESTESIDPMSPWNPCMDSMESVDSTKFMDSTASRNKWLPQNSTGAHLHQF